MESHEERTLHIQEELTDKYEQDMHVGKPEVGMGFTQVFIKEEVLDVDEDYSNQLDTLEDNNITNITELNMDIQMERQDKEDSNSVPSVSCKVPTVIKWELSADEDPHLYNCAHCDYHSSTEFELQAHLRMHSDGITCDEPSSYESCDYKSNQRENGKTHLRTPIGEKHFSCEFCNYKSNRSEHLKVHLRSHTGEKPFSCEFCNYKGHTRGNLGRHLKTHTGEKHFNCEFCDYKCCSKSDLMKHLRTHTGEKPFCCKFCDYKCSDQSVLKRHLRTHTGKKPFSCESCDYKCYFQSAMKRHLRTHTGHV